MRFRPYAWLPWPLRWLARVLTALLALVLVLAAVGVWITRQSFPQVEGTIKLPGLTGKVEVYRDAWGIPQIYADTSEDLFMAQGYVHAQDRFWEMDFRRHVTAGRLSELFGKATLTEDKVIRTMGWREVAEQELANLTDRTKRYLEAYAKGVNAYLKERPNASDRSLEYSILKLQNSRYTPEPWTPLDSVSWLKAMAWDLRSNLDDEIDRALASTKLPRERVNQLFPGYPFDRNPAIVTQGTIAKGRFDQRSEPRLGEGSAVLTSAAEALSRVPDLMGTEEHDGIGSNSWVVSGEHTTTGKPLLANDPHLSAQMPSVWYQAGLHCRTKSEKCAYDVTGFTFSGVPGVIIGHNDTIAWGFTNLGPDVADLFLEQVKDNTYLYEGQWLPLETKDVQIKVAGGDPVTIKVRRTRHGPLMNEVMGSVKPSGEANAVALQWTALTPGTAAEAIFDLNEARDWDEFRAAASQFDVPAQNLVYADTEGHIGYQAPGRIPVRAKGDGTWPVPGWTGQYEWKSAIPYDRLPSVSDPADGFVVTANNAVISPDRYQPLLTKDWSYGYRAKRILDRVEDATKSGKIDAETMSRIQQDTHNGLADVLVPELLKVGLAGPSADAQALLRGWDGSQGLDSAPAAYFNAVWRHLLMATFNDELPEAARPTGGDRWYEVVRNLLERPDDPFWDDVTTKNFTETRDDILRAAMADAHQELAVRLGADVKAWRWGDLHALTLTNQTFGTSGIGPIESLFNRGPFGSPGNKDAVNATGWNIQDDYAVTAVPSMRMIVDLADMDRSRWINLTGASGHAFHDNYWDQAPLWADGRTTPMNSKLDSIRKAARHTLTLTP
ncbi:penicillin acylase family protein [Nonomuraea sp. NPDC049152]|uniref:penicillin acylase family protein n=1 Tax=Nonomuraea sp. NPDC049152 TaxID=3154350 RepID=UPI0034093FB5